MKPEDVPDELLSLYGRNYLGASPKVAARRAMAAVLPAHERQVRERTLREAADLLDSKPLHCEQHGSVTCTECPAGSDHLRVLAARIARGES